MAVLIIADLFKILHEYITEAADNQIRKPGDHCGSRGRHGVEIRAEKAQAVNARAHA